MNNKEEKYSSENLAKEDLEFVTGGHGIIKLDTIKEEIKNIFSDKSISKSKSPISEEISICDSYEKL